MSTAFKSLAGILASVLTAAPAVAEGRVWTNRLRVLPAVASTAVVVRQGDGRGTEVVLGALDWITAFSIECYGRGAAGSDPADAVDPVLEAVWARLVAIDAAALGAMSITVGPSIEWQFDDGETPMACAVVRLLVQHRTPVAALTAWP